MIVLSISIDAGKKKLLKKLAKELGYNLEKAIKQVSFIKYLKMSICQFKKCNAQFYSVVEVYFLI